MNNLLKYSMLAAIMAIAIVGCKKDKDNDLPAQVQAIKDRGVLRVGVKTDVPYFGYLNPNTNEMEGIEIDIAKVFANEIIGNESAVEFVGVTTQTRPSVLNNGEVDLVLATFTITEERKLLFNFTHAYYTDEIGFLVKKGSFTTISELDGKTIAVAQAATTKKALEEKATELGITFNFIEYQDYPEMKAALAAGLVDAMSVDKSILLGYLDQTTMIMDEGFMPQEYGAATRLQDQELCDYFDKIITKMKSDGRLEKIIAHWGSIN
jgi:putative glutamine transport system substrate-binding protein